MRELVLKDGAKNVIGFPSFLEAVRSNENTPSSVQARATSAQIVGRVIEAGCWEDNQVALLLSDNVGLHLSVVGGDIKWEVIDATQFHMCRKSWTSDPDLITLKRRCTDGRLLVTTMDRQGMIARLIGRSMWRLVTDELGPSLHFQNTGHLLTFRAQIAVAPERPFLEWFEDFE
jgi:hypothetical protein